MVSRRKTRTFTTSASAATRQQKQRNEVKTGLNRIVSEFVELAQQISAKRRDFTNQIIAISKEMLADIEGFLRCKDCVSGDCIHLLMRQCCRWFAEELGLQKTSEQISSTSHKFCWNIGGKPRVSTARGFVTIAEQNPRQYAAAPSHRKEFAKSMAKSVLPKPPSLLELGMAGKTPC